MNEKTAISRRTALTGLAVGLTSVVASPVLAAGDAGEPNKLSAIPPLEDPRTKYPQPPFKPQKQPWPGLAKEMDPKPDHGEKSYTGSGRLKGRSRWR